MDVLTFVAEITKALAWPVVTIAVLASFRAQLVELLPKLGKFKYKEFELDFTRRLEEAKQGAVGSLPAVSGDDSTDTSLLSLAAAAPRGAVLEAWIRIEGAAHDALKRRGVEAVASQLRSPVKLVAALGEHRILTPSQIALMEELRGLRNSAAHASRFEPTPEVAVEYVKLAGLLERIMARA